MPRPDRLLTGSLLLAAGVLALGCGEAATGPAAAAAAPELARPAADPAAASTRGTGTEGAAGPPLGELRAQLSDPLVRDLLAGIGDPSLQEGVAAPLGALTGGSTPGPAALQNALRSARDLLEDASSSGSLIPDDELAVSALRLVLIEAPALPRTHRPAPSEPAAAVHDARDPDHREEQP